MIAIQSDIFLEIFELIFKAYANQTGIFEKQRAGSGAPQRVFCPKNVTKGSPDHLYWLALVAFTDKRTDSSSLYERFAFMFQRNSSLFRRGHIPSRRRMTELFRRYRIAVPVKEIGFFLERKRHLDLFFEGNPLKIYEGVSDIPSLMTKLKKVAKQNGVRKLFPGAKEKIFSLLAMFLWENIGLEFADIVPVDVWVQSIAASTTVLTGNGRINFNALERLLRPLVTKAFAEYRGVEGATNATWILGKYGCRNCRRVDMSNLCPVFRQCQGPFERTTHSVSGKHLGVITLPLNLHGKNVRLN